MLRAAIFDLDGTLLDTLDDIRRTLNDTLERFGYPTLSVEQAKAFVGNGAKKLVQRALPSDVKNFDEVFEDFRAHYATCDNAFTKPYDGELSLLKKLQRKGVKLAVVTNKPQDAAQKAIADCLGEISFEKIVGYTGDFPAKPDPTATAFTALTMRVAPSECVFIGDGETDVQTAINAGMAGVACLWGYRSKEVLQAAGATRFASDYRELEEILDSL